MAAWGQMREWSIICLLLGSGTALQEISVHSRLRSSQGSRFFDAVTITKKNNAFIMAFFGFGASNFFKRETFSSIILQVRDF